MVVLTDAAVLYTLLNRATLGPISAVLYTLLNRTTLRHVKSGCSNLLALFSKKCTPFHKCRTLKVALLSSLSREVLSKVYSKA